MNNVITNNYVNDLMQESDLTLKIFSAIDEEKKDIKFNEKTRSLKRLAWHITQTYTEMPHVAGLIETDALKNKPVPETIADLIAIYKKYAEDLRLIIKGRLNDETLAEEVNMYGEKWTKEKVLKALIAHQIHHRGQMTMLMRVLDISVPGIYGPSAEEWQLYNMPAME